MTFFYKIRCLDKQVEWLCGSGLFCLLSVSLCLCSAWVGWHNRMTGDAATGFFQMRTWKIVAASSLNGISCHTDKLAAMSELNFVARLICMEWDILQLKNNLSVLSGWLWNRDRSNLTVAKNLVFDDLQLFNLFPCYSDEDVYSRTLWHHCWLWSDLPHAGHETFNQRGPDWIWNIKVQH